MTGAGQGTPDQRGGSASSPGEGGFETRAETIRIVTPGDAHRTGDADRLEVGHCLASDLVEGAETASYGGALSERCESSSTRAVRVRTEVAGRMRVECESDTLLLGGAMADTWAGGSFVAAGISDELLVGGGMRVTAAGDLWIAGLIGAAEKIGTAAADGALVDLAVMMMEREYGTGAHAAGAATFTGQLELTTRAGFRPLFKVMRSSLRNLLPGSGAGAPGAAPPAPPAPPGGADPDAGLLGTARTASGVEEDASALQGVAGHGYESLDDIGQLGQVGEAGRGDVAEQLDAMRELARAGEGDDGADVSGVLRDLAGLEDVEGGAGETEDLAHGVPSDPQDPEAHEYAVLESRDSPGHTLTGPDGEQRQYVVVLDSTGEPAYYPRGAGDASEYEVPGRTRVDAFDNPGYQLTGYDVDEWARDGVGELHDPGGSYEEHFAGVGPGTEGAGGYADLPAEVPQIGEDGIDAGRLDLDSPSWIDIESGGGEVSGGIPGEPAAEVPSAADPELTATMTLDDAGAHWDPPAELPPDPPPLDTTAQTVADLPSPDTTAQMIAENPETQRLTEQLENEVEMQRIRLERAEDVERGSPAAELFRAEIDARETAVEELRAGRDPRPALLAEASGDGVQARSARALYDYLDGGALSFVDELRAGEERGPWLDAPYNEEALYEVGPGSGGVEGGPWLDEPYDEEALYEGVGTGPRPESETAAHVIKHQATHASEELWEVLHASAGWLKQVNAFRSTRNISDAAAQFGAELGAGEPPTGAESEGASGGARDQDTASGRRGYEGLEVRHAGTDRARMEHGGASLDNVMTGIEGAPEEGAGEGAIPRLDIEAVGETGNTGGTGPRDGDPAAPGSATAPPPESAHGGSGRRVGWGGLDEVELDLDLTGRPSALQGRERMLGPIDFTREADRPREVREARDLIERSTFHGAPVGEFGGMSETGAGGHAAREHERREILETVLFETPLGPRERISRHTGRFDSAACDELARFLRANEALDATSTRLAWMQYCRAYPEEAEELREAAWGMMRGRAAGGETLEEWLG